MRTVGEIIRSTRLQKKISLNKLAAGTKIKREFLAAIEKEAWDNLPEYPVVLGFVKNVASFLRIDRDKLTALLRRDYPPKFLTIAPKPDVGGKFVWNPRLTFMLGVGVLSMIIVAYLVLQYNKFVSPPSLELTSPVEGQKIENEILEVSGKTDVDATVTANNQPAVVDQDGNFLLELNISQETKRVEVVAQSRSGKQTTLARSIEPVFDE